MRNIYILVLCLLSTVVVLGQQNKPLTLQGRIVDAKAQPVIGAEVTAYEQLYDYPTGERYAKLLDEITRTDVEGRFMLNANIPVRHNVFVVARKEGLALGWDVLDFSTSGKAVVSFNIILEPPCILAGTVVDEGGDPVVGAKVRALPKTSYLERLEQRPILAPEQWFTTRTDNKGRFSFKNFPADARSDFWVDAPDQASVHKYTTNYRSACGYAVGRTDVRLILPPEVPIRGRVINSETSNPVPAANIVIRPDPDSIRANINPYCPHQAVSGQDGQFHFDGIPYGKHFIRASVPQNATLRLVSKTVKFSMQAEEPVNDVVVELVKGGQIEIVAREATTQEPICDVAVYFWQTSKDDESSFYKWSRTGTDGTLRVSAPPGECNYSARCDGYSPSSVNEQVVVTKGQTSRADILFDRDRPVSEAVTSAVRRRLIYAGKVTDTDGKAIPAARVSLWIAKPDALWTFGPEVLADVQGRYEIKAVPPEETQFDCRISVNAAGYGSAKFKPISIKAKQGTTVEMETIALKAANLSISGIVLDADGKPTPGLPVFLRGADQPDQSTATDASGRFVINRICEGPLQLQASFRSHPGGSGVLRAQGGHQNVRIVLGQEGVHVGHASLLGKPLPELKELKIELPSDRIKGRMLLVCFWDMQQRPSRNCIMQLSKKAHELKDKDIVVVVIQASKIDEKTLNEWVKKNNIPFPVGMIQDDEEKTRFAWGVKSLPWLILTNKERIVRAVGFGIGDLDEKLASIHKPITKEEIEKHQREIAKVEIRRLGGEIIVKTSENGSEYTEVKFLGPRYQNEWKGGNLGAKYLSGLCNLKNLRIQDVETFTNEGMLYLEGLNNLESLTLVRTQVTDNGLAHLKGLVNLEFLSLSSNKFTDAGLEHITEMTELKSLRLDDAQITNDGLKRLKQNGLLGALEFLSLNRTKISNEGLAHLTGMQNLKRLYLSDTQVGDEGISHLATLSKLEGIILNDTSITDAGLAYLKGLGNLNMLYLRNTQITDTGLEHIEELDNLVQLWVGGTKITDAGLIYLKALNKLESLDLSHTQVTNSGLAHLEGLTSLNELFLKYSGVTIDGYLDLNEALPDCRIYWEQKKDGEVGAAKEKIQSQRTVGSLEYTRLGWPGFEPNSCITAVCSTFLRKL